MTMAPPGIEPRSNVDPMLLFLSQFGGYSPCCPITPKIIRVVEESHFKSFPGVASLTAFHYDAVLGNRVILNRGTYENRQ